MEQQIERHESAVDDYNQQLLEHRGNDDVREMCQSKRCPLARQETERRVFRRREAELEERIREEVLNSISLNDAAEEMQRLIVSMTEENDAVLASGVMQGLTGAME